MTQESMEWLNQFTLVGYTAVRGNAWTYVEALQGTEPNHYEDAIPVEDVVRRLFDWEVTSTPLFVKEPDYKDGEFYSQVPNTQAMVRSARVTTSTVLEHSEWPLVLAPGQSVELVLVNKLRRGDAEKLARAWLATDGGEELELTLSARPAR